MELLFLELIAEIISILLAIKLILNKNFINKDILAHIALTPPCQGFRGAFRLIKFFK